MCTSAFSQLRLLLWKNFLLKSRRPCGLLLEILIPFFLFLVLILIRSLVTIDSVDQQIAIQDEKRILDDIPIMFISFACGIWKQSGSTDPRYPKEKIAFVRSPQDATLIDQFIEQSKSEFLFLYEEVQKQQNKSIGVIECVDGQFQPNGVKVNVTDYILNGLFETYSSEQDLDNYLQQSQYSLDESIPTVGLAVIFNSINVATGQFDYTIRANSSDIPFTGTDVNNLDTGYNVDTWSLYYTNHVLTLQTLIDRFLIKSTAGVHPPINPSVIPSSLLSDVSFLPFPVPNYRQDNFKTYIGNIIGMFLVCAFLWPFSRMVRAMVEEKEKKIKEGMRMMGMKNSNFWISWSVTYIILFFILSFLISLVCQSKIFPNSDFGLIFFFFFFFCLSLVSLACLLTSFFNRAKAAGTISPFLLLALYLPYFAVSDPNKDENLKNFTSLFSPVALSLGATNFLSFEAAFIGSHYSNASEVVENYTLNTAIGFMFFDFILYGFIAWYVDAVWPKEFGTAKKWWFIVDPAYWKGCWSRRKGRGQGLKERLLDDRIGSEEQEPADVYTDDITEPVPASLHDRVGVRLRNLTKEFPGSNGSKFLAVDGLNLDLFEGQIICYLGHNGAGKTTTINMLSGMIPISSGEAQVYGNDVKEEMDTIRESLGVCPQHDILFDDMTVKEHLIFFGLLKKIDKKYIQRAVRIAIEEVKLRSKTFVKASELSGGQRRRLSLAIALIGDSKVVFCDEPTSGVDPFSRRCVWELLQRKKEGRVIILTTHFMDEADQLGDRIAIMHKGKLQACGSSLYLKKKYGVGYILTLLKSSSHCRSDLVQEVLTSQVPSVEKVSDVGTELAFRLPFTASGQLPALLTQLDSNLANLHILNYGLSVTTLEEVFLRVAHEQNHSSLKDEIEHKEMVKSISQSRENSTDQLLHSHQDGGVNEEDFLSSALSANPDDSHFTRHFVALLKKRWHITKRDRRAACCQIIVPLILLLLGLGLLRIPPAFDFPNLHLNPATQFNQPLHVPISPLYSFTSAIDPPALIGTDEDNFVVLEPMGGETLYDFGMNLLVNRSKYEQSEYGAFYWGRDLPPNRPLFPAIENRTLPIWEHYWVWTNQSALHGLPCFLNLGNSALLRNVTNLEGAYISTSIHPFSWTNNQRNFIENVNGIFASIVISLAFSFVPASFAVFIVTEKEQKSKHLQNISGVSMLAYWLANYVWDMISYLIPAFIASIIIYSFQNPDFVGTNFSVIVLTFLMYGLSVIPFTYCCSFFFSSHSTAQNVMIMVYLLGGVILTSVAFALYEIGGSARDANEHYVRYLFRLIPTFCLGDSIFYLSVRGFFYWGKWDMDVSGSDLLFMFFESIIYFALTLVIEKLTSIPSFVALFQTTPTVGGDNGEKENENEDEDVKAERLRLQEKYGNGSVKGWGYEQSGSDLESEKKEQPESADLIRVQGLRKVYPSKVAVNNVWFGVEAGTCFGFLGTNGAGKTTTLKILTGDVIATSGEAFINNYNIATQPAATKRSLGYCPQFDALHEHLTAIETLEFYGRIRGIPEGRLGSMVNYLVDRLSLREYANRPAGTYSGGNKRKLSVAIALIGNPPCTLLDEPSTGMDPVSRRFMWDFIAETMSTRAVILTTHSMEECEALCNRIGILVNGSLKCIGSSQHLKTRFGSGLEINISTAANDVSGARSFLRTHFPHAKELECYGGNLKYKLDTKDATHWKLRDIFKLIEDNKATVGISEYSVGQSTLEQIFITFAREGEIGSDRRGSVMDRIGIASE